MGNTAKAQADKKNAIEHMNFAISLYIEQVQAGRYFLHEHPKNASSWNLPAMEELMKVSGVLLSHADQCQYGAQVAHGPLKGRPIKKPTRFLTNSKSLNEILQRTCSGTGGVCSRGGSHVHCTGRIAKEAAIYPRGLSYAKPSSRVSWTNSSRTGS
jgi:hypothetical protein